MCKGGGHGGCPALPPANEAVEQRRGSGGRALFWGTQEGPKGQDGWGSGGEGAGGGGGGESESRGVKSYLGSVPTSCKGLQTRGFESPPEASALLSRFQGEMKAAGTGTADAEWPRLPAERGFGSI